MNAKDRVRIGIVTGLPLAQNPRTAREAATLAGAGYEVVVLGAELKQPTLAVDQALAMQAGFRFRAVGSLRDAARGSRRRAWWWRLRHRLGRDAYRFLQLENAYQVGYFMPELAREAEALDAHYYVVHAEAGLWIGAELLRRGRPVGVDMEDWYSEDLLPAARALRPLRRMRELEGLLLRQAAHSSCPSRAMSRALEKAFGCPPPAVVYNASRWTDRAIPAGPPRDRQGRAVPSIHWYSQTLGEGRGLDDLMAALPLLTQDAEIHLRGARSAGFDDWLRTRAPSTWTRRIVVHEPVPESDLLARAAEHDIGFAGEQEYCRNKALTVSNKILGYFTAGLAVLASDTEGQSELSVEAGDAMRLYEAGNPRSLAMHLDALLSQPRELERMKAAALRAAESVFSWEHTAPVLLDAVRSGLGRTGPTRRT